MSTLNVNIKGDGDHPQHLNAGQTIHWKHLTSRSSATLASVFHHEKMPWDSPRFGVADRPYLAGRWMLTQFSPKERIKRSLLLALLLSGERAGTGLCVSSFILNGQQNDPNGFQVVINQLREEAEFGRVIIDVDMVVGMEEDDGNGRDLRLVCARAAVDRYNQKLVREIQIDLNKAIRESLSDSIEQHVEWKTLPKVWRHWLAQDNYKRLMSGNLGFQVRHDNNLTRQRVSSPGWVPRGRMVLNRSELEDAVLENTLDMLGVRERASILKHSLRKFILEQVKTKDLVTLSSRAQGDYDPDVAKMPHLLYYAHCMIHRRDP